MRLGRFARTPSQHAVTGVLRSKGFAVHDFDVREDRGGRLAEWFGLMGGVLRVRCRSTGEERVYTAGAGSAWLGAFLADLGGGHFASALRESANFSPSAFGA